jgi:hypothetical protein
MEQVIGSRRGFSQFTLARRHELLSHIKAPTICLIFSSPPDLTHPYESAPCAYLAIVSSRSAITTLDTRIKIKRGVRILPATEEDLVTLLGTGRHASQLRRRMESSASVITLSPKLSSALIDSLAAIPSNHGPMRAIAESLHAPERYANFSAMQEDAVQTAL